jgi:nucleoside-diphosphate-sugar epimerase
VPRYLVTGAAGFIGSHLLKRLQEEGESVVAVDRRPAPGVIQGDLLTMDLAPLVDGVTHVIHLAGQPGVRESWSQFADYARGNIETTQRLLEACKGGSIAKFVLASTSSVYGEAPMPASEDGPTLPVSPYGATKLAAEAMCDLYGRTAQIPWVALRYFTVYGPRQRSDMAFTRWLTAAIDGRPIPIYGAGDQVRDFTFVADVVEATLKAAVTPVSGVAINVGGGRPVSMRDAIALIAQVTGRAVAIEYLPAAPGDMPITCADTERMQRCLAFRPKTLLVEGLHQQNNWIIGGGSP